MIEIKDLKNHNWVIPLIALIMGVISLFVPAGQQKITGIVEVYIWMIGFSFQDTNMTDPQMLWLIDPNYDAIEAFIPSIICFSLLVCLLFVLLGLTIKERHARSGGGLIAVGLMIITVPIIYYFTFDYGIQAAFERVMGYPAPSSAWDSVDMGFGLYGPIISGIITLVGGSISKASEMIDNSIAKNSFIKASKSQQSSFQQEPAYEQPPAIQDSERIYCIQCGSKVSKDQDFCVNCGKRLNRISYNY